MATLAICICAMDRPQSLERCLESIARGSRLPEETIVSDDSRETHVAGEVQAVCGRFAFVRYVPGPRRGLCANRNHVIRQAGASHVSLLDDDAAVGPDFIERAIALAAARPRAIVTGGVLEDGVRRQSPTNPTFLGHFGRAVRPGERLENINLNCNVLPRAALEIASFDESITYGYEDTDLCAQMLARGFEIVHASELVNQHLPPAVTGKQLRDRINQSEKARLRVVWRRWSVHRRRPVTGAAVASIVWLHLMGHRCRAFIDRRSTGRPEAVATPCET